MKSHTVFTAILVAATTTNAHEVDHPSTASGLRPKRVQGDKLHRELRPIRIFENPTTEGAWGHCQGDCNIDADCYHNLVCFHRQQGQATDVPGCKNGDQDFTGADYCVFPGDIPTSGNLFEEHIGDHLNDEDEGTTSGGNPDDFSDRTNDTIIQIEDPDDETATDPPLSLVLPSGASSSLSHHHFMVLVSVGSAIILLAMGA